ncbi:MAG: hypothetical protein A3D92_02815 [Bacteroidetes bacterium RIFCSPHIGHO2_02_FULL_44_7]|nr:MAG: hypothetical protein A3D92_02815 [Bacteroidetes bacterium RIFCSPHIGHO2_02_FULL_44_7]
MIPVSKAFEFISDNVPVGESTRLPLGEALGHILAEDVYSPINMPPFPQSAMDGYALHLHAGNRYNLHGEIKAGDAALTVLKAGEAIRIFTGGMVPEGANAVARQEIVERSEEHIWLTESVEEDANIRPLGEQIEKGQCALNKGTPLNPGTIGYLASLGITEVMVHRKPLVAILTTGNELIPPGEILDLGKIYESNGIMLQSALYQLGFIANVHRVSDDLESTRAALKSLIEQTDILLVTGGISVGDYDFVGRALADLSTQEIFHKVKQKPGKPLYFGKNGEKVIFALPGNPAAALTCFYLYVHLALQRSMGSTRTEPNWKAARLVGDFHKNTGLTHFLKAEVSGAHVSILSSQSSAMLSSFDRANCILVVPEDAQELADGEEVRILPIPLSA